MGQENLSHARMFSCPTILFLVSLLFLYSTIEFNSYLPFKVLVLAEATNYHFTELEYGFKYLTGMCFEIAVTVSPTFNCS